MTGPTFVDLFSGAGGLTLGLQSAGWRPLLAVDNWPEALETYQANVDERHTWLTDIRDVDAASLLARADGMPEWIVGGAPCQGFSTVGRRDRRDARNGLVRQFQRLVAAIRPTGFLLENVMGLRDMQYEHSVRALFEKLGYSVSSMVLTSADFGVPQLRRRMIFVGHREERFFVGPKPSYQEKDYITVWDAIGDLPQLGPGETST